MRGKLWGQYTPKSKSIYYSKLTPKKSNTFKKPKPLLDTNFSQFYDPQFTDHRHLTIQTTTVHRIATRNSAVNHTPWIVAAVDAAAGKPKLLHPLTLKPHNCNLPENFNLSNFGYSKASLGSIHNTKFNFDKLVIPLLTEKVLSDNTMFVLHGGGKLIARPYVVEGEQSPPPWFELSDNKFDDIIGYRREIYVVDRLGKLDLICNYEKARVLKFNENVRSEPMEGLSSLVGWRKRFVADFGELYLVVREEEKVFRVYKSVKETGYCRARYSWNEVREFRGFVLFVSKDCCFFMNHFGGEEYGNCIMFLESGFPMYGDDGWEYNGEDEIRVFRMSDGRYGRVGESAEFPEIDWSPPSWVLDQGSCPLSHSSSQTEGESDSSDSNSKDEEEEQEVMELDSDSHDQEQDEGSDSDVQILEGGKLQCDSNADIDGEDVPPSILASVSAVEEQVTRTLSRMIGGNEATEEDTSRTNITPLALRPCTSSITKSCQNDSATAKFEGFDVRSDLVPILEKIWRNHGNIIEYSIMRSSDTITRAMESLATMAQILENTSVQSLSDSEADYLSSTLSDLKLMGFKVQWLVSYVRKALKLHKSKSLVVCVNKLTQLSHRVKDRRAILLDELAKLNDEEDKLTKEMAKVSNLIPFSGQVKFDEPLGLGLT